MPNDFILTPNMQMPQPIVGVTPGSAYASYIDSCLTILDAHTHVPGSGVQITPAAINVNSTLSMNQNILSNIAALTLYPQLSDADSDSLYVKGTDLYFRDGSANVVRITQSGSVAGATGTITGLPSGTASAAYAAGTFVFQSATATGANIDGASYILRNNTASSFGLTLSPPNAMGANYGLTLPSLAGIGGTPLIMTLDSAGNMATITANALIASSFNADLGGKAVTESGKNLVVSNTNATNSLAIVRARISQAGTLAGGEGIALISHPSAGQYGFTYTSAFGDIPSVSITADTSSAASIGIICDINTSSAAGCSVTIFDTAGALSDRPFNIIAIGQRA